MTAAVTPAGYCCSSLSSSTQVHSCDGPHALLLTVSASDAFRGCDASSMQHRKCSTSVRKGRLDSASPGEAGMLIFPGVGVGGCGAARACGVTPVHVLLILITP